MRQIITSETTSRTPIATTPSEESSSACQSFTDYYRIKPNQQNLFEPGQDAVMIWKDELQCCIIIGRHDAKKYKIVDRNNEVKVMRTTDLKQYEATNRSLNKQYKLAKLQINEYTPGDIAMWIDHTMQPVMIIDKNGRSAYRILTAQGIVKTIREDQLKTVQ